MIGSFLTAVLGAASIDSTMSFGLIEGGRLDMVIAATTKHRLLGLCLDGIGPIPERDGLLRIGTFVGL